MNPNQPQPMPPSPIDEIASLYQECVEKAKALGLAEESVARAADSIFNAVVNQLNAPPGMAGRGRWI